MISQHFVYVCTSRKISRTYGGSTYTMAIYEIKGKGKLEHVAGCTACTRAHMGEDSEVFTALVTACAIRPAVLKQLTVARRLRCAPIGSSNSYYHRNSMSDAGLLIRSLGGA